MSKVSDLLLSLSDSDQKLHAVITEKKNIEVRFHSYQEQLSEGKLRLASLEEIYNQRSSQKTQSESNLESEQGKILERRRQLTALGGAKAAKIMEREIDIATRTVHALEESVLRSIEELDKVGAEIEGLKGFIDDLEQEKEKDLAENEDKLDDLDKQIKSLTDKRDKFLDKLDARIKNVYKRVVVRYPGNAVSVASGGACRSCFRSLPPQTYNQILAGNTLIQCPGCSRLMVHGDAKA